MHRGATHGAGARARGPDKIKRTIGRNTSNRLRMGDTTADEAAPSKAGLAGDASEKGSWAELFRGGYALYSMLIIGGIALLMKRNFF